jgi:hypothetical protein
MPVWTIKCFVNEHGRDLFDGDLKKQSAVARAEFRATLNGLRAQPPIQGWCRPFGFDRLSGKYRDLGKLRFKADKVQHRPLGFFGPGKNEFTLLIWATERDGKFYPPSVRNTALKRMRLARTEPKHSHDCDF